MMKIVLFFKKAISIFFGCLFMLMTIGHKVNPIEPLDRDSLKLDIAIMSDIHIEGNGFDKFPVVPKCFHSLKGGKRTSDFCFQSLSLLCYRRGL